MSTERGRTAEELAARYLEERGYQIIERNWRNRWCELDIVAAKGNVLHLVEVKYRRRTDFGAAAEYVTADKVMRLRRAASAYVQAHRGTYDYQIDVITVEGELAQAKIEHLLNAVEG